ncbi:hypothetical protein CMO88_02940 [Candidatus Woesearchaeota archaeon]|nr:hypothetical protein [Candidatus Woesearchaeota archaeon]|tara:strand:+ start:11560 stop:12042 length:483 start_codon:yes stop_codon:yes gene_type:complete
MSKIPYKALEKFVKIFQKEYKVDLSEVLKELKEIPKEIEVPASVFSRKLSSLETICKYLKENLGLSYHEIAELLNRNDRTIWITYRNASKKVKSKFVVKDTKLMIPVSVIANRKLSVLEAIVSYLRKLKLTYHKIAVILKRDQRNIWTVHSRAKKKWKNS